MKCADNLTLVRTDVQPEGWKVNFYLPKDGNKVYMEYEDITDVPGPHRCADKLASVLKNEKGLMKELMDKITIKYDILTYKSFVIILNPK